MSREAPRSTPHPSDLETQRRIFADMPLEEKGKFLNQQIRLHKKNREDLIRDYQIPLEEAQLLNLLPAPKKARIPKPPPEKQERSSSVPVLTEANTHFVDAEHLTYTKGHARKGQNDEISAFIRSACSMADYGIHGVRKNYVKIDFANGSRAFRYTQKEGKYIFSVVTAEGVVDDFAED